MLYLRASLLSSPSSLIATALPLHELSPPNMKFQKPHFTLLHSWPGMDGERYYGVVKNPDLVAHLSASEFLLSAAFVRFIRRYQLDLCYVCINPATLFSDSCRTLRDLGELGVSNITHCDTTDSPIASSETCHPRAPTRDAVPIPTQPFFYGLHMWQTLRSASDVQIKEQVAIKGQF
jgi:hypothetical protein